MSALAELDRTVDGLLDCWRSFRLGDVADISRGTSWGNENERREPVDGALPVLGIRNVQARLQIDDLLWLDGLKPSAISSSTVQTGDILMVGSNGNPARIGNSVQVDEPGRYLYASLLFGLRPRRDDVDPDFLYYAIVAPGVQTAISDAVQGTTGLSNLKITTLRDLPVLLPPLDEQRRIAEVLRSVDEAIAAADLALAQAKLVQRMTVNELLSPNETMAGRLCYRLSEVISVAHGFAFKSEFFTTNRDDPVLLTPGNFSVEKTLYFGERTKHYSGPIPDGYVLENGSLVVVMTDLTQDMAILGNAVEINAYSVVLHNQRIGRVSLLRPDLISKGYARLLLNSDLVQARVKATASGSTVRHTAPSRILECEVRLPDLDEQARIVAIAKSLDDVVSAEERRRSDVEASGPLSHLRDFKRKIANDLLSGQVRVPA